MNENCWYLNTYVHVHNQCKLCSVVYMSYTKHKIGEGMSLKCRIKWQAFSDSILYVHCYIHSRHTISALQFELRMKLFWCALLSTTDNILKISMNAFTNGWNKTLAQCLLFLYQKINDCKQCKVSILNSTIIKIIRWNVTE